MRVVRSPPPTASASCGGFAIWPAPARGRTCPAGKDLGSRSPSRSRRRFERPSGAGPAAEHFRVSVQDFVFEIRTEEIPAPALLPARLELSRRLNEALAEEGLAAAASESYAAPSRLAVG